MKKTIQFVKVCTVISFLFVVIPGDKVLLPMWMALGIGMLGASGPAVLIGSLINVSAIVFILVTNCSTIKNVILLIAGLVVLLLPVLFTFNNVLVFNLLLANLTYALFAFFWAFVILMLIARLKQQIKDKHAV